MNQSSFAFPAIVEHHYTFCAWLLPKISKFQKDQRYILGTRLQNAALDTLRVPDQRLSHWKGPTKEEWLAKASQRL